MLSPGRSWPRSRCPQWTYINSSNRCALAGGSGDWNVGPCTKMLWVSDPCNVPQATDQCLSLKSINTSLGEDLKQALKSKDPSPPQRCECALSLSNRKTRISFFPALMERPRDPGGRQGDFRSSWIQEVPGPKQSSCSFTVFTLSEASSAFGLGVMRTEMVTENVAQVPQG